jgi:hypothetical protein
MWAFSRTFFEGELPVASVSARIWAKKPPEFGSAQSA